MGSQTEQECLSYWLPSSWEASSEFGERGKACCSAGSWGCSELPGAGQASGSPTPWTFLPFWCRRSQERVSVHPHRLHPSFDFGHQLQTPQPRYLAEGTDW